MTTVKFCLRVVFFVTRFDRKRTKFQSREKAERDKLIHKLKKERKGALREIRRDKDFLGRVKVQQRIRRWVPN